LRLHACGVRAAGSGRLRLRRLRGRGGRPLRGRGPRDRIPAPGRRRHPAARVQLGAVDPGGPLLRHPLRGHGGATIEWGAAPGSRTITVWTEVAGIPAELQPVLGEDGRHAAAVVDFLRKVRSEDWAGHDGSLALRRAEIIDACYASAKKGAEV